jgi:hypothetical protein
MRSMTRSPALHFLLLGALLFTLQGVRQSHSAAEDPTARRIAIDRERMAQLERDFAAQTGRRPSPRETRRLVDREVEEEILYREALARGLLDRDGGVQTRLIQKMLFLESGRSLEEAPDLLARAIELGLHREDVVVRRILVQKMRLLGSSLAPQQRPTDAELRTVYRAESESLRAPDRRTLVHVFLSRDRHGEETEALADRLAARLRAQAIAPADGPREGDPFPLGHRLEGRSRADLARQFGGAFGDATFAALPGRWSDPIGSAYGSHLVFVEQVDPGEVPPFEAVAERLRLQLEQERREKNLEALLADLRTRYEVVLPTSSSTLEAG